MMLPRARIAPDDQAYWQRRAHAHLGQILFKHSGLWPLRWSLAPYGCGLAGEVAAPSAYTDAYSVEHVFAEWQHGLGLSLRTTLPGRLKAVGRIDVCHITISAVLPDPPRKDLT